MTLVDNEAPGAGGNIELRGSSGATEDLASTLTLAPSLSNADGPTPTAIRILSVTGGQITAPDGTAISLGPNGRMLDLVSGRASVVFTSEVNRNADASLTYVVVDPVLSSLNSAPSTVTVAITPVNDRPVLTLSPVAVTFIENTVGVAIAPSLSVTDIDSTVLSSARVSFASGRIDGDTLDVALGSSGLSKSVSATDGSLTISGNASIEVYRQLLQSVVFSNSRDDLSSGTRTFNMTVTDNSGAGAGAESLSQTRTISVLGVNDAPVVLPLTVATGFTEASSTVKTGSVTLSPSSRSQTPMTLRVLAALPRPPFASPQATAPERTHCRLAPSCPPPSAAVLMWAPAHWP